MIFLNIHIFQTQKSLEYICMLENNTSLQKVFPVQMNIICEHFADVS